MGFFHRNGEVGEAGIYQIISFLWLVRKHAIVFLLILVQSLSDSILPSGIARENRCALPIFPKMISGIQITHYNIGDYLEIFQGHIGKIGDSAYQKHGFLRSLVESPIFTDAEIPIVGGWRGKARRSPIFRIVGEQEQHWVDENYHYWYDTRMYFNLWLS